MWTRGFTTAVILPTAFFSLMLIPGRAAADPVRVGGVLSGVVRFALVEQQLDLVFPDFKVSIGVEPQLKPGFCMDGCGNGTAVSFTQTTGAFSGHSTAFPGGGTIDADVTGMLQFVGPTQFVSIDPLVNGDILTASVQALAFLRITQPNRILFDGTLIGSALASVSYENRFGPLDTRLSGYQYEISGLAETPEPASLVLLGTGLAWLARRRGIRTARGTANSAL